MEQTLHRNILDLINDLKDNVFLDQQEQYELNLIKIFYGNISAEQVMQHAIQHIYPHKEYILSKNLDFFKENDVLFKGLDTNRVSHYTNKIYSLDQEDLEPIWDYFILIIKIVDKYNKNK